MFRKLFKLKPKESWRLVKTMGGYKVTWRDIEGNMYYHLSESNRGRRKLQVKTTLQDCDQAKLEKYALSTNLYNTVLFRWLSGRGDPEIPRYSEVDQEETMHVLRGTIKDP